MMNPLSWLFLIALATSTLLRAWLSLRQMHYVQAHRASVPDAFAADIELAAHQKAADYTVAKSRLGLLHLALEQVLVLGWTLGGGLGWLDSVWRQTTLGPLTLGVLVIASYVLINSLIGLPISLWSTFVTEARFGFNRTTLKTFLFDLLKMLMLAVILGGPLLYAVLWLMQASGSLWWVYVWALWTAFSLIITWAWPVFIAPLFNRFAPLEDQTLKQRIESLLQRCGFTSRGVFVMDGSTRSAHGNAYFTGFGNNKRIVFFDTLMDKLAPDEIESVLAHELGHFRLRHVIQRLLVTVVLSLAGLGLLGWLSANAWFYNGLGVQQASPYMALLLFLMLVPPFLFLFEPLMSGWSRRHEFQADAYAAQQADGAALIRALVKLYRDNASTLTPDPLYSLFNDSHPPAPTRVAHLQSLLNTVRQT